MKAVRAGIGVLGEFLITAGVLLLLFLVWQLWWTDIPADRAQSAQVQQLEKQFKESAKPMTPIPGGAFAVVRIPRFGATYAKPLYEGTDTATLKRGIGHYLGTALPGQVGNFSMAGHRTTYGKPFNLVAELKEGDKIIVQTRAGTFTYAVRRHEIVLPTDIQVIAPVPDKPDEKPTGKWLTMTSCHPMFSAANRYVIHAELESTS